MRQELIKDDRVVEEVKKAIGETLNIDAVGISENHSLIKDLGAESLDFLDINYRLEQVFGIKMARHFILEHIEEMFGEGAAIDPNGLLTEKAVKIMKLRLGENSAALEPGMDMDQVPAMITVATMARGVMDILDSLPDKCACGASSWKSEDGTHVVCSACSEEAPYTDGDDLIKEWLTNAQESHGIF